MQYILSLLPLLACPVGMGLVMWFMMRGNKSQAPPQADQVPMGTYREPVEDTNEAPKRGSMLSMLFMCLNWKVVAGLAVVGLIVWVLAPQFLWAALPLLIVAACPLSMLFMMRGMQSGRSQSPAVGMRYNEQLPELQSHLSSVQAEQEAIASRIGELEHARESAISEDETVAHMVDERTQVRAPSSKR